MKQKRRMIGSTRTPHLVNDPGYSFFGSTQLLTLFFFFPRVWRADIVFIGELYKEHMLTDKIMHECVFRRLLGDIKNPVEADLEALCKLMNTIGKVLDVPKAKGYMDAYFKRMKNLTQNPNIPSRIRFLLLVPARFYFLFHSLPPHHHT